MSSCNSIKWSVGGFWNEKQNHFFLDTTRLGTKVQEEILDTTTKMQKHLYFYCSISLMISFERCTSFYRLSDLLDNCFGVTRNSKPLPFLLNEPEKKRKCLVIFKSNFPACNQIQILPDGAQIQTRRKNKLTVHWIMTKICSLDII